MEDNICAYLDCDEPKRLDKLIHCAGLGSNLLEKCGFTFCYVMFSALLGIHFARGPLVSLCMPFIHCRSGQLVL